MSYKRGTSFLVAKSTAAPSHSSRSKGGELVSLPSDDEGSESDAEATSGESESSAEESD